MDSLSWSLFIVTYTPCPIHIVVVLRLSQLALDSNSCSYGTLLIDPRRTDVCLK